MHGFSEGWAQRWAPPILQTDHLEGGYPLNSYLFLRRRPWGRKWRGETSILIIVSIFSQYVENIKRIGIGNARSQRSSRFRRKTCLGKIDSPSSIQKTASPPDRGHPFLRCSRKALRSGRPRETGLPFRKVDPPFGDGPDDSDPQALTPETGCVIRKVPESGGNPVDKALDLAGRDVRSGDRNPKGRHAPRMPEIARCFQRFFRRKRKLLQ